MAKVISLGAHRDKKNPEFGVAQRLFGSLEYTEVQAQVGEPFPWDLPVLFCSPTQMVNLGYDYGRSTLTLNERSVTAMVPQHHYFHMMSGNAVHPSTALATRLQLTPGAPITLRRSLDDAGRSKHLCETTSSNFGYISMVEYFPRKAFVATIDETLDNINEHRIGLSQIQIESLALEAESHANTEGLRWAYNQQEIVDGDIYPRLKVSSRHGKVRAHVYKAEGWLSVKGPAVRISKKLALELGVHHEDQIRLHPQLLRRL